jgi:ethanolamine permease
VSFIILRRRLPGLKRPYRSPLGIAGAVITLVIAIVTLVFQLLDPVFAAGIFWVGVWFVLGIIWFALVGQNRLVKAPEEAFATEVSRR